MSQPVTYDITIDAPPSLIFDWIENPQKQPLWMKGVIANEPEGSARHEVGAVSRLKIREGGRVAEYRVEVTEYDPPRRLTVVMTGPTLRGLRIVPSYRLDDLGGGRTALHYECAFAIDKAPGLMMRVMMWIGTKFGRRQLAGFMASLKRQAEAEARGGRR